MLRATSAILFRLPLRASLAQGRPLAPQFLNVSGASGWAKLVHSSAEAKAAPEAETVALLAKADAARARKAEAEAEMAAMDAAALKALWLPLAAIAAFLGLLATLVSAHLQDIALPFDHAEAMRRFERRRIDAIKERILLSQPSAPPSAGQSIVSSVITPRPQALKALERMSKCAGIYMVEGPKGAGKSTLISQFASLHPHVLYVNLQVGSMDRAVREVAAALDYDMTDSAAEARARKHGFQLPDLHAPQSTGMYEALLSAFEAACKELRSAGMLVPGHVPVLVLDHANRPLRHSSAASPTASMPAHANLMYSTVEAGYRFANWRSASLVMVTSDQLLEQDAWRHAHGLDWVVRYICVAPFSDADAAALLSRRIFASRVESGTRQPTPEDLAAIQSEYSSTITTVTLALGTRARWLVQSLQHLAHAPLTDAELAVHGVPIPALYHPFLPMELRDSNLRIDPGVWRALQSLLAARRADVGSLLSVSDYLSPFQLEPDFTRFAQQFLAVDAALRALLLAPIEHSVLKSRYFASAEHVLCQLIEQEVLFHNHDTKGVEMHSSPTHRVVTALLASKDHELSVLLVQLLLAVQAARHTRVGLVQQMQQEKRGSTWFKSSREYQLERDLDAACQRVNDLQLQVDSTRAALRSHRQ